MMNIDENEMYASRTVNTSAASMSQYLRHLYNEFLELTPGLTLGANS